MSSARILVISNHVPTSSLIRATCATAGYTVYEATTASDAIDQMRAYQPQLVFHDLLLPHTNHYELLEQIHAATKGVEVPVFALVGLLKHIDKNEQLNKLFTGYLFKPLHPAHILEIIQACIPSESEQLQLRKGLHVLIVDDDAMQRKLLKLHLELAGCSVTTAEDGLSALAQARESLPEVIVSDILMPKLDGFRLCQTLRQDPLLQNTPIILTSASFIEEADQAFARDMGATQLIVRTPNLAPLLEAIQASLVDGIPQSPISPSQSVVDTFNQRLFHQVESLLISKTTLARRLAEREAELALLNEMSLVMEMDVPLKTALHMMQWQCMQISGASHSALYMFSETGQLELQVQIGYPPEMQAEVETCFGQLDELETIIRTREPNILSPYECAIETTKLEKPDGRRGRLVIPLNKPDGCIGVLVIAMNETMLEQEHISFAKLLGCQIGRLLSQIQAFAELREREANYHMFVNNISDCLYTIDILDQEKNQFNIHMLNTPFKDLLGYTQEDLDANPTLWLEAIHPDDIDQVAAEMSSFVVGKLPEAKRYRLRKKDSTDYTWFEDRTVPQFDNQGNLVRLYGVMRDITERHAAEEAQIAKNAAEQANKAKSNFLSRMSHELRTPLNAVLGFAQLLKMDQLTADQEDSVNQILSGGRHLLTMLNEVLDITRIELGRLSFSCEPVQIDEVIQNTLSLVQPLANATNIRLQLVMPIPGTGYVLADRQRLIQVLLNLLSNAIKYNHPNGSVTVEGIEVAPDRIRISIHDTGIGIAEENIARLFTPFDRLGAEHTEIEGTGLGLALSRNLLEAMGGSIEVKSVIGKGSTFSIELPMTVLPIKEAQVSNTQNAPLVTAPDKIYTLLYIEDNLTNFKLIERLFAYRPGVRLLTSMQGSRGIELAAQHHPDLILLDLHLPDMQGDAVLQHLKEDPHTQSIPVVMLSADSTPRQIERLMAAGAYAYLTKPLDLNHFLNIIEDILHERSH